MLKLVGVRELEPERDAAKYAEQLLKLHPRLFARIEGGPSSVISRMAARTIAVDHLREVCRLPAEIAQLERSLTVSTKSAGERLVRVAGLAYLVCDRDLIRDDLPAGYGLIDDCIALRAARLATPRVREPDRFIEDLVTIRYLAVAVPDEVLPATEAALIHAAEVEQRTRALPDHVIEATIQEIVNHPPSDFPTLLDMLPAPSSELRHESPLRLEPGELIEANKGALLIAFPDGTTLHRAVDGELRFE